MKYVDEYRDASRIEGLITEIQRRCTRTWTIMEVCGGQTHSLLRHGIDEALRDCAELIHGPGCPVCVTGPELIDLAIEFSKRPNVTIASFGDMLRVPGRSGSLLQARAAGADVRLVYSPLDAVKLAQSRPDKEVVFFAVGFETTTPATALAVKRAAALGLSNFTILAAHVRVLPAMELLAMAPDNRVQGFLAAGHVSAVMGYEDYRVFVERFRLPVVVAGFEPLDLLLAIRMCIESLETGQAEVRNAYGRGVRPEGNRAARTLIESIYQPCNRPWRGIGDVAGGGYELRPEWSQFDARRRFQCSLPVVADPDECISGEILTGRRKPKECAHFGKRCTPESPLGAPMVSAEGACAAYYRYATVS